MELKNKKAIVIGGSKGIGAEIAKELKKLKHLRVLEKKLIRPVWNR